MKKTLLLVALFAVFCCRFAIAQNSNHPWFIGYGVGGPQMTIGDDKFYKEYFRAKNWNTFPSFHIKLGHNVGLGFATQYTLSVGYAARRPTEDVSKNTFIDFDVNIKYSFANGYILKEKCWFDPYIIIGGGVNRMLLKTHGDLDLGAGFNIWLFKNFGVFMQASYNYVPHKYDASNANDYRGYMHHTLGFVTRFGKGKDKDKDGVPDAEDKCPDVPGKLELNGCPDTDGDGIADALDLCPLVPGLAAFGGCPDTDGDGITDTQDGCPNEAGSKESRGCPDKDGDGVLDKDDACPTVKGSSVLKGCPDTDGDGISDADDKCPAVKGLVSAAGCPDADGDGVADADDKCPSVFGLASSNGCPAGLAPELKQEVQKKLSFAAANIEFESSSDKIRKSSFDDLDNVANIMGQYSDLKIDIDGHTDNSGKESLNVDLSLNRAVAVYNYLIKKGVAANRLSPSGYGSAKPLVPNTSPEGKAKNRRVELNIK